MSEVLTRIDARITGRVQGVGFRYFTTQQARRLGVEGWVRNEANGAVRVVAEGPREVLEDFLNRLKEGPAGAKVQEIESDWREASGEFGGFAVRYR